MSETNTQFLRGKKYLTYVTWIVAIVITLSAIAYIGFNEYARYSMRALNCEILSVPEFEKYFSDELSAAAYIPEKGELTSPVHFDLDLGAGIETDDDTLVVIDSSAIGFKPVYKGPYQRSFTIQAGKKLLEANYGNGADSFTVGIVQKSKRKICTGVIESIRPWQANKTVHIKLLPFRELNELGLPETFKVTVE